MVLTGGQQATAGQGRMFYIKSAASALSITCDIKGTGATIRKFLNIGAGFKFVAPEDRGWTYLRITSALSQNIEIIVGDDDVEVANAVSVTGSVTTQESPSSALATPAAAVRATGGADTIAANPARRRITVASLSTNTGSLFLQATGAGAGRGIELQPGTFVELKTTAAFDVRNDSGVNQTYMLFEET
jgi:hypothetical protein